MQSQRVDPPHDEIEHLIAWHDGDSKAAIRTLLDDCKQLRNQLALAESAMGTGFTRGWRPSADASRSP